MEMNFTAKDQLISVVYVSSGKRLSEAEVIDILRVSRFNNSHLNITGLLAYKDGNFLQVLEGPESSVTRVLETIERDRRHSGMIILAKRKLQERLFPEWSMAFRELKDMSPDEASAYSPFLDGSLVEEKIAEKPDICYKLLLSFKQAMR